MRSSMSYAIRTGLIWFECNSSRSKCSSESFRRLQAPALRPKCSDALFAWPLTTNVRERVYRPVTLKSSRPEGPRTHVRRFFAELGPGLITGAADDDPSGISTYSVTGAAFGFAQLWTVFFAFPLMFGVQCMCARLGLVSGQGLAGALRRRYPMPVLLGACVLLAIANTVNIGADLGGMAEAMQMMTGITAWLWLPLFAGLIVVLLIWSSYRQIAR